MGTSAAPERAAAGATGAGAAASPFESMTFDRAKKLVTGNQIPTLETNRKYVEGDHWQGGAGWMGPRPRDTDTGAADVMAQIERGFTSRNVIAEVVKRHRGGVVGREPHWRLVPREPIAEGAELDDSTKAERDQLEAWLTDWWNARRVHAAVRDLVDFALWGRRAVLRAFVPTSRRTPEGSFAAREIPQALEAIFVEALSSAVATVYTDDATKEEVAVYAWEEDPVSGRKPGAEIAYLGPPAASGDPLERQTMLQTFGAGNDAGPFALPFGGRLTMHMIERPLFITPQIIQGQKALNLALSTIPRTVTTAGFLERVILNGQMPGEPILDAKGNVIGWKPAAWATGAGTVQWIRGVEYRDEEGRTQLATPSVEYRDPVEVKPARDAKESHYEDILEEASQGHILIGSDARPSGKSHEQARADYATSLSDTAGEVNACVAWLLELALAMAEAATSKPGRYLKRWRVEAACVLDTGPVSPEERSANREDMNAGILSRETAQRRGGVVDVDAERSRIENEPEAGLGLLEKRAGALEALVTAGATIGAAARLVGFTEEEAQILEQGAGDGGAEEPDPNDPGGEIPPAPAAGGGAGGTDGEG